MNTKQPFDPKEILNSIELPDDLDRLIGDLSLIHISFPEFPRRYPCQLCKHPAEVALVIKRQLTGDFRNGQPGIYQQPLCLIDFLPLDIFQRGTLKFLPEPAAEMVFAHLHMAGKMCIRDSSRHLMAR